MLKYHTYLTEARISQRNLEKAIDILKRIIERELSTRLYRFGGPKGYSEIKNGMGILFTFNRGRAIRFNYISGEIQSLTLWKKFRLDAPGDFTVDLDGLGLLQAGKHIIDIIRNPATGTIKTYGEITEENYLTEARRISPQDFFDLVNNNLPPSVHITKVPWSLITDIALSNDVNIPTVVRSKALNKGGPRGKEKTFNLTVLTSGEVPRPEKAATDNERIYYIKLTGQDPNTKKFMSVKGDKKAEALYRQIQTAVENPDYKEEAKDPDTLFGHMAGLTRMVARGARNSLVITGGPGIGKTWVVTDTIQKEGLTKGKDWIMIKGKITTSALYATLFMHRKGTLIVFDDADSMWNDQEASNILKAALDSYDERIISWVSPRTVNVSKMAPDERKAYNNDIDDRMADDPESTKIRLPSEFEYEGRIIFISNMSQDKMDSAVLNRSAKIDMTLTQEQIYQRMRSILPHLGDKSVPLDIKNEILDVVINQGRAGKLEAPSMRTYVGAEDIYKSGDPDWRSYLIYI